MHAAYYDLLLERMAEVGTGLEEVFGRKIDVLDGRKLFDGMMIYGRDSIVVSFSAVHSLRIIPQPAYLLQPVSGISRGLARTA